ncbi:MAG: hypothetical protein EPO22_13640 [Dehalococcoidia bacterium]|nr:MAG: hypothetical protein EPO22_13640 [Dehalococcoidia bacterium]
MTVGADGEPYIVGVFPDSQIALSASTSANVVLAGDAQLATAQVLDGETPIPATITATVFGVDGSQQDITLVDDGTQGDAVAGDNLYSQTISTAGSCGTVRLLVSADVATSSEGPAHREQFASFDVHVPGDAVRDPCSADDDGDGLTDTDEYGVYATSPVNFDTDGDGLSDGDEVTTHGTDPLVADTDGDGLTDGDEVNTYGTNPLVGDTDGDGLTDGAEVNSYATNPLVADTDGDGLSDGAEVNTYATNPLVADTDGDGLSDGAEVNTYATNPLVADTDDDGCGDGKEFTLVPPIDPLDPWDFYSVPVPALFVAPNPLIVFKDKVVSAADSQAIFGYFTRGARTGTLEYEQDLNANGIKDGLEYDRSVVVGSPGASGPPNGVISAADAQLAFSQFTFGYHC